MLGPLLCGRGIPPPAPLLPKLRGHFAEFLGSASSVGLGILSLPTCVGLRYGRAWGHSGFSRQAARALRYFSFAPRRALLPRCGALPRRGPSRACAGHSAPGQRLPPGSPHFLPMRGTGISARLPSATRPRLALGPDSPRGDQLHPGTLGHPAGGIRTPLSLLIPAFSLRGPPPRLTARLRRPADAPLPARQIWRAPRLRRRV